MASEGEFITNKTGSTGEDCQIFPIQDSLRTITGKLDDIGQLKQSIDTINKDLWDEHGLDERIKYIGPQYEKKLFRSRKSKENYLRKKLQVLKSVVINLDRRVFQQENEIIDLKCKSMRDNILIHNLEEEEENEDLS